MASFWFGININNFLFESFQIDSILGFVSVCIFIAAITILYEAVKMCQGVEKLKLRPLKASPLLVGLLCCTSTKHSLLLERQSPVISEQTRMCQWNSILLYTVQLIVGYLLMLTVMTYNAYLMISIIIGTAVGYFLFGSLLLHLTAQIFLEKASCNDCQVSTDGQTTPIIDRSGFDNESLTEDFQNEEQNQSCSSAVVNVQVHSAN